MENGFIMIPRAIQRFAVMKDCNIIGVYVKLMLLARFRAGNINGINVGINQILMSKPDLAEKLNMSVGQLKGILSVFVRLGGIRCENVRNKYTLITILPPFLSGTINGNIGKTNPPPVQFGETDLCDCYDSDIDNSDFSDEADDELFTYDDCTDDAQTPAESGEQVQINKTASRGQLIAFGKFHNVYLSQTEYDDLSTVFPDVNRAIDKFSASLVNNGGKIYDNHYAKLYQNAMYETDIRGSDSSQVRSFSTSTGNHCRGYTPPESDAGTSYDLKEAERRAKSQDPVIKLSKKRP